MLTKTPLTLEWLLINCDEATPYPRFIYRDPDENLGDDVSLCIDVNYEQIVAKKCCTFKAWLTEYVVANRQEHDCVEVGDIIYQEDLKTLWHIVGGNPNRFKNK